MEKQNKEYIRYRQWKKWMSAEFGKCDSFSVRKTIYQLQKLKIPLKNKKALELGFGNGSFLAFLKKNGCSVTGIEIQEQLVILAKTHGFRVFDSLVKIKNEKFDYIFGFDVLEHLTVKELRTVFCSLKKLTHQDSLLIFRFPNADSFTGLSSMNGDFTHKTAIGKSLLGQILDESNFQLVNFSGAADFPPKKIHILRNFFRLFFRKSLGISRDYFFDGDVVAVIKPCEKRN